MSHSYPPRVPHTTPTSASSTRRPVINPYDKFTKPQFDGWVDDLTTTLRRALGRDFELEGRHGDKDAHGEGVIVLDHDADEPPRAAPAQDAERLPLSDQDSGEDYASYDDEDASSDENVSSNAGDSDSQDENAPVDAYVYSDEEEEEANDTFASLKARKGKARDPREGPGLAHLNGHKYGSAPADAIEVADSDAEGEEYDEEEDEDDEAGARGSSPPDEATYMRGQHKEFGYATYEQDEEEGEDYSSQSDEDAGPRGGANAADAIELISDDEDGAEDAPAGEGHTQARDELFDELEYENEDEQAQPSDAEDPSTTFPPHKPQDPAQPTTIVDPWASATRFAQDLYTGGDRPLVHPPPDGLRDPHRIGDEDAEVGLGEDVDEVAVGKEVDEEGEGTEEDEIMEVDAPRSSLPPSSPPQSDSSPVLPEPEALYDDLLGDPEPLHAEEGSTAAPPHASWNDPPAFHGVRASAPGHVDLSSPPPVTLIPPEPVVDPALLSGKLEYPTLPEVTSSPSPAMAAYPPLAEMTSSPVVDAADLHKEEGEEEGIEGPMPLGTSDLIVPPDAPEGEEVREEGGDGDGSFGPLPGTEPASQRADDMEPVPMDDAVMQGMIEQLFEGSEPMSEWPEGQGVDGEGEGYVGDQEDVASQIAESAQGDEGGDGDGDEDEDEDVVELGTEVYEVESSEDEDDQLHEEEEDVDVLSVAGANRDPSSASGQYEVEEAEDRAKSEPADGDVEELYAQRAATEDEPEEVQEDELRYPSQDVVSVPGGSPRGAVQEYVVEEASPAADHAASRGPSADIFNPPVVPASPLAPPPVSLVPPPVSADPTAHDPTSIPPTPTRIASGLFTPSGASVSASGLFTPAGTSGPGTPVEAAAEDDMEGAGLEREDVGDVKAAEEPETMKPGDVFEDIAGFGEAAEEDEPALDAPAIVVDEVEPSAISVHVDQHQPASPEAEDAGLPHDMSVDDAETAAAAVAAVTEPPTHEPPVAAPEEEPLADAQEDELPDEPTFDQDMSFITAPEPASDEDYDRMHDGVTVVDFAQSSPRSKEEDGGEVEEEVDELEEPANDPLEETDPFKLMGNDSVVAPGEADGEADEQEEQEEEAEEEAEEERSTRAATAAEDGLKEDVAPAKESMPILTEENELEHPVGDATVPEDLPVEETSGTQGSKTGEDENETCTPAAEPEGALQATQNDTASASGSDTARPLKRKRSSVATVPAPTRVTRSMSHIGGSKSNGKGKGKLQDLVEDASSNADSRSEASSSSGASVASRMLAAKSTSTSRASSVVSHGSSGESPAAPQSSPARPAVMFTLSMLHHHHRQRQGPPAGLLPLDVRRAMTSTPAEPQSPSAKSDSRSSQPSPVQRRPSLTSSPVVTRSQCKFHKISVPREENGPRVFFIVPGCSLSDMELRKEKEIEDHGDATMEEHERRLEDIESLDLPSSLIGVLRQLAGVDLLREQEVFYLPAKDEKVRRRKKRRVASDMAAPKRRQSRESSQIEREARPSLPGSPLASTVTRLSPSSSIHRAPISAVSTSASVSASTDSRPKGSKGSEQDSFSTASASRSDDEYVFEGEEAEEEEEKGERAPKTKKRKSQKQPSVAAPSSNGDMGPPSASSSAKGKAAEKGVARRSKRLSMDAAAYKPEDDSEEDSSEVEQPTTPKLRRKRSARGVKRTRAQEGATDATNGADAPKPKKPRVRAIGRISDQADGANGTT